MITACAAKFLVQTENFKDVAKSSANTGLVSYTVEVTGAVNAINGMSIWQRTLNAAAHPNVKAVRAREQAADAFLRPIVEGRKKAQQTDPDFQKPDDLLQWLLDDGQGRHDQHR